MRSTFLAVPVLAAILSVSATSVAPQSSTQSTPSQNQTQPGMMHQGMMGQGGMSGGMMGQGKMDGGTMGMMGQMSTHHQQMTTLMNKLMQSMPAIQSEKDPAALKSKLAEHDALLKQMRAEMTKQGAMMKNMSGQMRANCAAAADNK